MCKLSDTFFDEDGWEEKAVALFEKMKPYNDFMNAALDDYYNV